MRSAARFSLLFAVVAILLIPAAPAAGEDAVRYLGGEAPWEEGVQSASYAAPTGVWTPFRGPLSTRSGHAMVYDEARGRVVLFGGTYLTQYGDTWEWDGKHWEQVRNSGPSPRWGHAMAYDSARGRTVLFGGHDRSTTFGDTWEWDGEEWQQVSTSGPPRRSHHAMAYDNARGRVVLFGHQRDTWEWDGKEWEQVSDSGPSPRSSHAMAYDSMRGRLVLFGGNDGSGRRLGDTWEWDGKEWEQVSDSGPSPRLGHAMAYDNARGRVVLFGAWSGTSVPLLQPQPRRYHDTWEWDGKEWGQVSDSGPSPYLGHAMAYDSARERLVLFGHQGDTWEWDGKQWEAVRHSRPFARLGHAMADDGTLGRVLLFGGQDGQSPFGSFGDTWKWDGGKWEQVIDSAPPPARSYHALAYDGASGHVVLFGGWNGSVRFGDTWAWDGERWGQISQSGPPPRSGHAMAYDSARSRVVLFGGEDSSPLGGTWEWDGVQWAQAGDSGPPARQAHAMAYDSARGRTVLFGGHDRSTTFGDTWEWDGEEWQQVSTSGPPRRSHHAMAYDSERGRTVLFGGLAPGGPNLNDTWEWDGETWRQTSHLGPDPRSSPAMAYHSARQQIVLFGGARSAYGWLGDTWVYSVPEPLVFDFEGSEEGWGFHNPTSFSPVVGAYRQDRGSLSQTPADDLNAFGFWESPEIHFPRYGNTLPVREGPALAGGTSAGRLHTAEFLLASDGDSASVPDMRLRASSRGFHRSDVLTITSGNRGDVSPAEPPRMYRHLFRPAHGAAGMRLSWDVMSFTEMNDAGVAMELLYASVATTEEVALGPLERVMFYSFEGGQTNGFTPRTAPTLRVPEEFRVTDRGLLIRGIAPESSGEWIVDGEWTVPTIFGYWGLESPVPIEGGTLYRFEWKVQADGVDTLARRAEAPTFRFRVNDSSLQTSYYINIDSRDRNSRIPMDGRRETYVGYFEAPPEIEAFPK